MESESSVAFGYDIGAGFTFLFTPKWGLNFNVDYFGANFNFEDIVMTSSNGSSDHLYNVEQSVSIINTTLGVSFNF
jgi:opacity protein-like surface antigen